MTELSKEEHDQIVKEAQTVYPLNDCADLCNSIWWVDNIHVGIAFQEERREAHVKAVTQERLKLRDRIRELESATKRPCPKCQGRGWTVRYIPSMVVPGVRSESAATEVCSTCHGDKTV